MEHVKTWALEDLSTKWRAWKNELKNKYYDEDKTPEQMFEHVKDPRVNKDQFLFIAAHWLTTEAKTEENNGIPPSRADVYIRTRTRTRKDGNVVNDKATEFVQCMKGIIIETSEDSITQETSWKDDVFSKVVGPEKRSGRVRCSGIKSSLSNKSGPSSSQPTQQNQEVQGLKTEVQNLRCALKVVLNVLQRQFPDESEEMLNTITRVVNGEVLQYMFGSMSIQF
ncbi:Transposase, Ptta/En/Spm, plant [Corchorus olitorius]|uniref:Transposase, Ptta/En/Spm, plant n=1 Tax=Corchorus olitorius TaxID=93759 RepID=A0A1R3HLP5_9ROSI|nr:Transposase, Ptta/En/Spm, plant [Corchorus olitorius]